MGGGVGQQGHNVFGQGQVPVSMNIHGPTPAILADTNFEPNFRHFDFYIDVDTPNADLVERVYKVPEGEAHWDLRTFWGTHVRCMPVAITSLGGAMFCNFMYTRFIARSAASVRWSFFKCYAAIFAWNNFTKYYARERYFLRDFQRNQIYSYDELRKQRELQRVREVMYESNFTNNPLAEYRIKAWQVANRFA